MTKDQSNLWHAFICIQKAIGECIATEQLDKPISRTEFIAIVQRYGQHLTPEIINTVLTLSPDGLMLNLGIKRSLNGDSNWE